jgi:hypothetical protein
MSKVRLQTALVVAGCLLAGIAVFAQQLGLDHNPGWGTSRLVTLLAGILLAALSGLLAGAVLRGQSYLRSSEVAALPWMDWLKRHFPGDSQAAVFEGPSGHLSVIVFRAVAVAYVTTLGVLTILTHIALAAAWSFETYARLALIVCLLTLVWLGIRWRGLPRTIQVRDLAALLIVVLAGGLAGWMALHLQPEGPLGSMGLDDYYFLASPVYYLRHPDQPLSFVLHDFYSGGTPFSSVSFFIAGAWQYIQAAFAYLLHINFLDFSYLYATALSTFMFPLSVYLVLTRLTSDTRQAAIGAAGALLIVLLLGEAQRTPGLWIFSRVVQGKSIVVSTGVCLLTFFSLEYFQGERSASWLNLCLTSICLTGMSTTAIMLLPTAGALLFLNYFLVSRVRAVPFLHWFTLGLKYLATFAYLVGFALIVAVVDTTQMATHANQGYPNSLAGYVHLFFWRSHFPTSALVLAIFSVTAVLLTHGLVRRFLAAAILLPFLILNPPVSDLLIQVFQGVYFRMFYILPLFIVAGLSIAQALRALGTFSRPVFWLGSAAGAALMAFSLFRLPTSALQSMTDYAQVVSNPETRAAQAISQAAPAGLMLAPYPLSSTLFLFDPDDPQMYIRPNISELFLWKQGREPEAVLRAQAGEFLLADDPHNTRAYYAAFRDLVRKYPGIRTVAMVSSALQGTPEAAAFLQQAGFLHRVEAQEYTAFWK